MAKGTALYKKTLASILCCILIMSGVSIASATAVTTDATAEQAGVELQPQAEQTDLQPTAITSAEFANPRLLVLPQYGDLSTLSMPNDITLKLGPFEVLRNLSAKWNFGSIDTSITGMQYIEGRVILSSWYSYLERDSWFSLSIKQPVWVYGGEMTESETVFLVGSPFNSQVDSFAEVPWGSTPDELDELLRPSIKDEVLLKTAGGLSLTCFAVLDYSLIDTSVAGTYYPYRILTPAGLLVDESSLEGYDLSVVVLENEDGDGDDEGEEGNGDEDEGNSSDDETGPSSDLETNILSTPTVRDLTTYVPPTVATPTTQSEPEDTPEEAQGLQASLPETMTSVEVLGAELNALAATTQFVPFKATDVEVLMPSEALLALGLKDTDRFSIHMESVPSESVTVLTGVNDELVTLSSTFYVDIPWSGEESLWFDEAGNSIASTYYEDTQILRLDFVQSGTVYYSAPQAAMTIPQTAVPLDDIGAFSLPLISFLVTGLLVVAIACVVQSMVKRRRRKALESSFGTYYRGTFY